MSRPKRPWFRFYVEAIWDRKIRRLSPAHRWLWVSLLALARQSPMSGYLMLNDNQPLSWADVADASALKLRIVEEGTDALQHIGLIAYDRDIETWFIPRWNERQYESDDVTERTAKHRFQEQPNDVPGNTPIEQRQKTESETETEPLRAADFVELYVACSGDRGVTPTKTMQGQVRRGVQTLLDEKFPTSLITKAIKVAVDENKPGRLDLIATDLQREGVKS